MRLRAGFSAPVAVATVIAALLLPGPLRAEDAQEAAASPQPDGRIFTLAHVDAVVGKAFDLVVLRPLGLSTLVVGATFFVPVGLMCASDPESFHEATQLFVTGPAQNVFTRPLGDF